jgi:threonyl-tRNA synthetase
MNLWKTSGHAANFSDNMFVFEIDGQEVGLKPLNCPGHWEIFSHKSCSYRELPLCMGMPDFGVILRNEASGALTGLTQVRRFVQDDAYIFCRESQVKDEVEDVSEIGR